MLISLLPMSCPSRKLIGSTVCILRQFQTAKRRFATAYEPDGKTTVSILNQAEDSPLMIDSYSRVGFRLNNGLFILGPMVIFPNSVLSWNVGNDADITLDTLSLFLHLEPKPDVLVIGTGDINIMNSASDSRILELLHKENICAEVLPTERACATFNFLNSEKRFVAAALIPPMKVLVTEADFVNAHISHQKKSKQDYLLG